MSEIPTNFTAPGETVSDRTSCTEINVNHMPTSSRERPVTSNVMAKMMIKALDALLTALVLPYATCQWIYKNDHLMIMIRVLFEVTLELVMWLILAGVSVLTAATLILDDVYCGKQGSGGYSSLVKSCHSLGDGSSSSLEKNITFAQLTEAAGKKSIDREDVLRRAGIEMAGNSNEDRPCSLKLAASPKTRTFKQQVPSCTRYSFHGTRQDDGGQRYSESRRATDPR